MDPDHGDPSRARAWTFALVDLAGFTALTESHGDEQAADLATKFADLASEQLAPGDRLVKTIGDAVLLAASGPGAGLTLVRRLLESCYRLDGFPVARAALHHGSAVERGGDLFGAAVNLVARVAGQAAGGQVLATREVALAARDAGVPVTSLGDLELHNIAEPVELFDVELCPLPDNGAIDPVCRMRVDRRRAAGRLVHAGRDYWFCSLRCVASFAASPERIVERG